MAKLITSTLAITTRDAENGVTIILSGGRGGVPLQFKVLVVAFFAITQYNSDTHDARTLAPMNARIRKHYPYEHL